MNDQDRMSWNDVVHFIAQGAINISEGLTEIEADSPVHKAMQEFCRTRAQYLSRAQAASIFLKPTGNLKPCPFCGGQASVFPAEPSTWVRCESCLCSTPPSSEATAIAVWNHRREQEED